MTKAASPSPESFKRPESVLVVIYSLSGEVLLLQRADVTDAWQSVTGSMRWDEQRPVDTAIRELREETGLVAAESDLRDWQHTNRYPIHPLWKPRYHPDQTHNTEYVFSLGLPGPVDITPNPKEHSDYAWCSFADALERIRFATNREAVVWLMEGIGS